MFFSEIDQPEPRMSIQMVLDDDGRELTPEERLIAAILRRAYADLRDKGEANRIEAYRFFSGSYGDLRGICQAVGLDPNVVSRFALDNK